MKKLSKSEINKSIEIDLLELEKSNLSINVLMEDIQDDPESYNYTLNDLELYLIENN